MGDVQVATMTGTQTVIKSGELEAFQASLRGELLRAGDAGYDTARTIWNALIDHWPALIARCAGAADIIAAVTTPRRPSGSAASPSRSWRHCPRLACYACLSQGGHACTQES